MDLDPNKSYPGCTSGKRACPPEDGGGPHAYQELLHPVRILFIVYERRQAREVLGRNFGPEAFARQRC